MPGEKQEWDDTASCFVMEISLPPQTNNIDSVAAKSASFNGCVTLLPFGLANLTVCYSLSGDSLKLTPTLNTPVGNVPLGEINFIPHSGTAGKLEGSIGGFKAEIQAFFDFAGLSLSIDASICVPFLGCESGSINIALPQPIPTSSTYRDLLFMQYYLARIQYSEAR